MMNTPSMKIGGSSNGNGLILMWFGLFCLFLGTVSASSLASSSTTAAASSSSSSFISYPLTPRHSLERKRRKERQLLGLPEVVVDEEKLGRTEPSEGTVRRRTVAQQIGALYQGYGTHYIDLWCGSPPQRQTVIVDTGSGVTAFPCTGCNDCGVPSHHIDALFKEEESSTFHKAQCDRDSGIGCTTQRGSCQSSSHQCSITMSYAEGSRWDATESIDKCYVGGPHHVPLLVDGGSNEDIDPNHASHFAFDLVFGCQTKVTGLFKTQLADGIMGMDTRAEAFWSQMFRAGKLGDKKQFALCFSRQPSAARTGTESGALTLGGVDTRLHLSDMLYTPKASSGRSGFYSVKVRAIYVRKGDGGISAKSEHTDATTGVVKLDVSESTLNSGGIIVDSGTTDTYWNKGLAPAFKSAYQAMTGKPYSQSSVVLSEEELLALPTILFQLQADEDGNTHVSQNADEVVGLAGSLDPDHPRDIILALPPTHYMEYDEDTKKYTARFYVTENGGSVLGANAIMGHDVMFDVENDRIGWAESVCDYTHLLTDNGFSFDLDETKTGTKPGGSGTTTGSGTSGGSSGGTANNNSGGGGGTDTHENQNSGGQGGETKNDDEHPSIQEILNELVEACDSMECRISIGIGMFVLFCLGCCLARCFCSGSSSADQAIAYQPVGGGGIASEVEMSSGSNGHFGSYKDKPAHQNGNGNHEAEFDGDFS